MKRTLGFGFVTEMAKLFTAGTLAYRFLRRLTAQPICQESDVACIRHGIIFGTRNGEEECVCKFQPREGVKQEVKAEDKTRNRANSG